MKQKAGRTLCSLVALLLIASLVPAHVLAGSPERASPAYFAEIPSYHGWHSAITYDMGNDGNAIQAGFLFWCLGADTDPELLPSSYVTAHDNGDTSLVVDPLPEEAVAGTGMCVRQKSADTGETTESILIVYGDVIGNGECGLSQVVRIAEMYANPGNYPYY